MTEDALRRAGSAWTESRCWLEVNSLALPKDSAIDCARSAAAGSSVGENSPSWVGSGRGHSWRVDGLRVGSNAKPLQLGRGGWFRLSRPPPNPKGEKACVQGGTGFPIEPSQGCWTVEPLAQNRTGFFQVRPRESAGKANLGNLEGEGLASKFLEEGVV